MKNKYQEAFKRLKNDIERGNCDYNVEPYLNILQELVDKETAKKPITIKPEGNSIWDYPTDRIKCPNCSIQLPMKKNCLKKKNPILYCSRCGQRLDWSDTNE